MFDYVIIGQGIAGTTLAFQLLQESASVYIIDSNPKESSSKIASGLWNPVVLKRMKKVWLADAMIAELQQFYPIIEMLTQAPFVEDLKIQRILHSIEEQNNWSEISEKLKFEKILNPVVDTDTPVKVNAPFGLGTVEQSGRINVLNYIESSRQYFIDQNIYLEKTIEYNEIEITENSVNIENISAKHIVFCEGHQTQNNPWFSYLPLAPTKGEVLLGVSALSVTQPLHGGKFILPLGDGNFKIGATYAWDEMDGNTTEKGKTQLLEGWKKMTSAEFKITKQQAGIRPTVKDRRPLLGTHPTHGNLHVFNGLGSRGILMAPYLAKELVDFLLKQKTLHPEMDIARFKALRH